MIRLALILFLTCLTPPVLAAPFCTKPTQVLLTSFEPFQGPQNGSQLVAAELLKVTADPCVQYQHCTLPVDNVRGTAKAIECFEKATPKPALVISMGESPSFSKDKGCPIELDSYATNNQLVIKNNIDVTTPTIEEGGPRIVPYTLPIEEMYCAVDGIAEGPALTQGPDTGFGQCNYVAYKMAQHLKGKQIPYGFIHVPWPKLWCKNASPKIAGKLTLMVLAAVRAKSSLQENLSAKSGNHCRSLKDNTGTGAQVSALARATAPACRDRFLNNLKQSEALKEYSAREINLDKFLEEEPLDATSRPSKR